jgi:probable HAF family extracellular repeat protein
LAINNFGQLTGWSSTATSGVIGFSNSAPVHAFLYGEWTGMEDIGTLGGTNSYGYSINIRGQVTGYSDVPGDSGQHAFLYRDGKMIDLNTLLPRSSRWTLLAGYGINDRGQITGYGLIKGQTHAFLMTPVR